MKVAIFTPAGAAGARLIEAFHLSRSPTPVALAAHPADLARAARFPLTLRVVDPGSADSLAAAFGGCSAAVLAPEERADPASLPAVAAAFATGARQANLRRIAFISDIAVYGTMPAEGTDEDSRLPLHAPGTRAAMFAEAEHAFLSAGPRNHPGACVLRAGHLYGARAEEFARLIRELSAGTIDGEADEAAFNGLHVDNLVAAVRAALTARTGEQRVFHVTDTGALSARGFRRMVSRELGLAESGPAAMGPRPGDEAPWHLEPTSAHRVLGYRPDLPPEEAVSRACAWWRFVNARS